MGDPLQMRFFFSFYTLDTWLTSCHVSPLTRVRFCPKTIYFIPVKVQIILYELSLNYYSTSKIFFKNLFFFWVHRIPITLKNVKILTVLEFDEIRLGSKISRDDSNSIVCFIIRDLENFQILHLYYRGKLQFYP